MSKQYRIETLGDFLKIPADRIEECMEELACHLTAMCMTLSVWQVGFAHELISVACDIVVNDIAVEEVNDENNNP